MEDLELERRVWERVAERENHSREEDMDALQWQARQIAEEYRALAARMGDRNLLAGIRREEQEIARILAGIRALRQGGRIGKTPAAAPVLPPLPPGHDGLRRPGGHAGGGSGLSVPFRAGTGALPGDPPNARQREIITIRMDRAIN